MQYRNRSRRGGGRRRAEPEALSGARARSHAQRNRSYSTTLGRFISRDPTGYLDGLSLYAYVAGRATLYGDPTGLGFWSDVMAILELVPGLGTIINAIRTFILGRPGMDPGDYSDCAVVCNQCAADATEEQRRCRACVGAKEGEYTLALWILHIPHTLADIFIGMACPAAQVPLLVDAVIDAGIAAWATNRVMAAADLAILQNCNCNPCAQAGG